MQKTTQFYLKKKKKKEEAFQKLYYNEAFLWNLRILILIPLDNHFNTSPKKLERTKKENNMLNINKPSSSSVTKLFFIFQEFCLLLYSIVEVNTPNPHQ